MSWGLWERFGVEEEFMIVDKTTLDIVPRADLLLQDSNGTIVSDLERGAVGWSNELVSHVIELKAAEPLPHMANWSTVIGAEIAEINSKLNTIGACLLPTAVHPWMNPAHETVIWPHEYNEIYQTYDRIFDCRGHGWSNLQSVHLNLPFQNDVEFGVLHGAIRAILPLLPAVAASSPYLDGTFCGYLDGRLETYRHNQERIPVIAGAIIPEPVFTQSDYESKIFAPVRAAIAPFDTQGILSHHFLNSRGAIARFDRGAIEIRIIDLQECPHADLVILQMAVGLLRLLSEERWVSMQELQALETGRLAELYHRAVLLGDSAVFDDSRFLRCFGFGPLAISGAEFWRRLWPHLKPFVEEPLQGLAMQMLDRGTLSSALLRKLGRTPSREALRESYGALARCLAENRLWDAPSF